MACYTFALRHCGESGPIADFLPPNDRTLMAPFLASNRPSCGVRQVGHEPHQRIVLAHRFLCLAA